MYRLSIDESGSSDTDTVFVMCGLLIDVHDRQKLTNQLREVLAMALGRMDGRRKEFKTSKFIREKGMGLKLSMNSRREILKNICSLSVLNDRKILGIGISFNAVDLARKEKHSTQTASWLFSSMFICALLQNRMQNLEDGNQKAEIEFDDHPQMSRLSDRLKFNCDWYDGLYRVDGPNRFDRIVNKEKEDISVDSRESPLVQAADVVSYVYRRHLEICGGQSEREEGEAKFIRDLIGILEPHREKLGNLPKSDCLDLFKEIAHPSWAV